MSHLIKNEKIKILKIGEAKQVTQIEHFFQKKFEINNLFLMKFSLFFTAHFPAHGCDRVWFPEIAGSRSNYRCPVHFR